MDQVWSCHSNQSDALLAFVCVACSELIRLRCICIYFLCVFQRLRDIVCCDDIEETMSLICSGAKVIIFIHTYILWLKFYCEVSAKKNIYIVCCWSRLFLLFFLQTMYRGSLTYVRKFMVLPFVIVITHSWPVSPQVRQFEIQNPSLVVIAEKAGQALQSELLRLNEYTGKTKTHTHTCMFIHKSSTYVLPAIFCLYCKQYVLLSLFFFFSEVPPHTQRFKKRASCSTLGTREYLSDLLTQKSALQSFCVCSSDEDEEEEELHGKLEEDRFLFSVENDSAACDVLDLREVLSVFTTQNGSVIAQLCSSSYGRSS